MKLKVHNFQSLKDVEFDFPVGVTIICGENNTGKTAVFRSIRTAITNKFRPEDLSWGEKESSVELKFEDGSVKWSRVDDKSIYDLEIAGKKFPTFRKTERKIPPEVSSYLNMSSLEIDNIKLPLNLLGQWESFFFVEESGTKISRILGKLSGVDQIFERMKDVSVDFSEAAKKASDLNYEVECLFKAKKEAQEKYQDYLEKYNIIKSLYQKNCDLKSKLFSAKKIVQNINTLRSNILDKKVEISRLNVPLLYSTLASLKTAVSMKSEVCSVTDKIKKNTKEKERIQTTLPALNCISSLAPRFSVSVSKKSSISVAISSIKYSTRRKEILVSFLSKMQEVEKMSYQIREFLSKIQEISKYNTVKNTKEESKKRLLEIERELKAVKEEQDRIKACPLCQRTF